MNKRKNLVFLIFFSVLLMSGSRVKEDVYGGWLSRFAVDYWQEKSGIKITTGNVKQKDGIQEPILSNMGITIGRDDFGVGLQGFSLEKIEIKDENIILLTLVGFEKDMTAQLNMHFINKNIVYFTWEEESLEWDQVGLSNFFQIGPEVFYFRI